MQYDYVSSDHRPLSVTLSDVGIVECADDSTPQISNTVYFNWDKANTLMYENELAVSLSSVNIPRCLFGCA